MPIDLSRLPPPSIIDELTYEQILQELKNDFAAEHPDLTDVLDLPSEPLTQSLERQAYRETLLRRSANDRARSLLLAYARGPQLDHLGTTYHRVERLEGEPDDRYLERIRLGPDSVTAGGSAGAYQSLARAADARVKGCEVWSPAPPQVRIAVLSTEGDGSAPQAVLDAVQDAVGAQTARPLNDQPLAVSADIITYTVAVRLQLAAGGPDPELVIAEARRRIEVWTGEQHRLGQTIVIDALRAQAYVSGVERVELDSPGADIPCQRHQAAYCTSIEVTRA